ncbi:MAG: tetratricopeptide repeat protein [Candidatus Tectomicrobia bacterium]|uniref:Tetratricopeptide repeat protein n=1 Tax=Tectimicrobiota bacterium TaxID=2528274 RepID=A0A933GKX3_UNCTE|nr:tetratricopeptide repeat protein [Candidatus Tectomicrobia bacterium]
MIKSRQYLTWLVLIMSLLLITCGRKDIISSRPDDADIYYRSGLAFLERGQLDLALNEFNKALQINPIHLEALNDSGIAYLKKGNLDQAATKFKEVIKLKSDSPIPHRNLGSIYLARKMVDEAISEFKQAVQLAPQEAASHYLLAKAFLDKGLDDMAMVELKDSIKLKADYGEALKDLAFIYHRKGHESSSVTYYNDAISKIKDAVMVTPSDAESHQLLGELYLDIGAYSLAIFEFREALRIKPELVNVYKSLAFALTASSFFDQAIETLRLYRNLFPEDSEVYCNLGHIYYMIKEDHLAAGMYSRALELDSKSNAALWLYLINLRGKKKEEGNKILQRFAQKLPKDNWQVSLANYLSGYQNTREFTLPDKKENRGPAFFFLGSYYLNSGRKKMANEYLLTGTAVKYYNSWEFLAARQALEELNKG